MKEEEFMESGDLLHMLGEKSKSKYSFADLWVWGWGQGKSLVRYHTIMTSEDFRR